MNNNVNYVHVLLQYEGYINERQIHIIETKPFILRLPSTFLHTTPTKHSVGYQREYLQRLAAVHSDTSIAVL